MTTVHLHLGSNEGDKLANLITATKEIEKSIGKIIKSSSYYETEAWGKKDQDAFINMAAMVNTELKLEDVLKNIQAIEKNIGSVKTEKWGPRKLDIDILFYGSTVINKEHLKVPHPEIQNRNFVLVPLMEIDGEFTHPVLGKSIEELYDECNDECEVYIFEN